MDLKQAVEYNLESLVTTYLISYGSEETLAYDISKQCVSEEDVEGCLAAMLEHLDEDQLETILNFFESDLYKRFHSAMESAHQQILPKIKDTLVTLTQQSGEA